MRLRLFLSFLLIVLVTSAALLLMTTWRIRGDVVQFLTRGGLSGNVQLVEDLEAHFHKMGSWEGVDAVMLHQRAGQGGPMGMMSPVTLVDAEGRVLFVHGQQQGGPGPGRRQEILSSEELKQAIALYEGNQRIGYLLPDAPIVPMPGIEAALQQRLTRSAMIAAGIAASFSLVLATLLAYFLMRPVRELTRAAEAMGRGDLSQRVRPRGGSETALLARTFNEMAESLQNAEARRKALTADIAHELRNPLAIQRANIEAMLDGLYPLEVEQLEPLHQQNMLLERLVDDLRTLALADAGHLSLEKVPTDLAAFLERRINEMKPEADAKNVRFALDLPAKADKINLDPARIGQIITNLIANALRFSPENGTVYLNLASGSKSVVLTVRDEGPGIKEEDLPFIFERFYRGDRARNRDDGSTGLGLSIARRLAQAHEGSLETSNHPDGGAVFRLTLPINAQE